MSSTTHIPLVTLSGGFSEGELGLRAELCNTVSGMLSRPPHFVLLSGMPPNEEVDPLVRFLQSASLISKNKGDLAKTRIEIQDEVALDAREFTRASRTANGLAPHTDTTFRERPYDILAFQFVRADEFSGESIAVSIDKIVASLSDSCKEQLTRSSFPFGDRTYPILSGSGDSTCVRYSRDQIIMSAFRQNVDLVPLAECLDEFHSSISNPANQYIFRAGPGDVVLFDNTKCLHGRKPIRPQSNRLMIRLRGYRQ